MKKLSTVILIMLLIFMISACDKKEVNVPVTNVEPQPVQMKAICELATMKCYYHNVAKYKQENAEGFWLWQKDRHFWIEYSGIVTIGIDVSKVNVTVDGEQVTITMPPAQVLECEVDDKTLSEESFIIAQNSASVGAEQQIAAFAEAQQNMEKQATRDTVLLSNAQDRAKSLLTDYVNNIGEAVGKKYSISWVYLDSNDNVQETTGVQ